MMIEKKDRPNFYWRSLKYIEMCNKFLKKLYVYVVLQMFIYEQFSLVSILVIYLLLSQLIIFLYLKKCPYFFWEL